MQAPWELNPLLNRDHLHALAYLIQSKRNDVIDLKDEELGDTPKGTGLRVYECTRSTIIKNALDKKWPWLSILKSDGRFTFSISGVPVRFYRGRAELPEQKRMIPCAEALRQMDLLAVDSSIAEIADTIWLFAVETDKKGYAERVTLTGHLNGAMISSYEIPLGLKVVALSDTQTKLAEPFKVGKASVGLKKKHLKQKDDDG